MKTRALKEAEANMEVLLNLHCFGQSIPRSGRSSGAPVLPPDVAGIDLGGDSASAIGSVCSGPTRCLD